MGRKSYLIWFKIKCPIASFLFLVSNFCIYMATTPEINRAYQEYVTKVEQTVNDKRIAWQPSWTLPYLISMTVAKRLVYSVRNNVVAGKLVLSNFKQPKPIHVGIKQVKVPRRKDYLLFDMDSSQAEGVVPGEWCDSSVKFDPCHPAEKVVLYAHGGVYIGGSRKTHRQLTWRIAKDAGARILSIDYRLAPEHKFPLALHDMLSCYLYLIDPPAGMPKYQPEQIFFAGDSSGGNLALVTALYIRDHCDKIPLPGGLILLNVLPSRSFDKKHLGPEDSIYHVPSHLPITDPMISPLFAKEISEKPLPPVMIAHRTLFLARPRFVRAASTSNVGFWGPMTFAGVNWVGKGALPFGFSNRAVWYSCFTVISAVLFSIPFVNLEINVVDARPDARKKQKELIEIMKGETSMKLD
ncbi:hypothetical protein HDU79_011013 [Rhizoclosmatium sp. JEL0117]|nr:hypothetical protein HDU79_011013 [Rhizoclosmatium sp. JEL0117]